MSVNHQVSSSVPASDWLTYSRNLTEKIDYLVQQKFIGNNITKTVAFVATGGYGRQEMVAGSDIDLLVFSPDPLTAQQQKALRSLGTLETGQRKLSFQVHDSLSLKSAIENHDNLHLLTSLLDRRLVTGSKKAFSLATKITTDFIASRGAANLIAEKLHERDARHLRLGDSRYALQPDIKEGKGALRDLHTLRWIIQLTGHDPAPESLAKKGFLTKAEATTLQELFDFFNNARHHLHLASGRANDRLGFEWQPAVALVMGYSDAEPNKRAEKFMHDYFMKASETGYLLRVLCTALEDMDLSASATAGRRWANIDQTAAGLPLHNNRLLLPKKCDLTKQPEESLRLFRASQETGTDIHPDALRSIRKWLPEKGGAQLAKSKEAYALFLDVLLDDYQNLHTLRHLGETGMISALIPAFENIRAHMQYDMYHVYAADEHTFRACAVLHDIEQQRLTAQAPLSSEIFKTISPASRSALFLAMLLHDMGKGTGGDHARAGAKLAADILPRFPIDAQSRETAVWLIENHLLMTMTAFKRDLEDDQTISDFASAVQSPERLKLLTLLTVADIMAVGPDQWNNWKAGLLRQLYDLTRRHLVGEPRSAAKDLNEYLKLTKPVKGVDGLRMYFDILPDNDHSRLVVATSDKKGLFALLTGAIASAGASVASARIHTLPDGTALDIFELQDVRGHAYENTLFLTRCLTRAFTGKLDINQEIAERRKLAAKSKGGFTVAARVIIDIEASNEYTLVEVNGADRPGLLHDLSAVLTAHDCRIHAAKVATFGRAAIDVFYIKDAFGLKITHAGLLAKLEKELKIALQPD